MIKKINSYLLTHYPLIWNTRIVWVLCIAILIHAGFYLTAYTSVTPYTLPNTYSMRAMLDFNVVTFAIFTSIIVCIFWLVFYLRNNAYKDFYLLSPGHNTKQFLLILLGFLSISTFFESYQLGLYQKIKSITSKSTYIEEVNTINEAMVFIPVEKNDYFKLNNCNTVEKRMSYGNLHDYTDTLHSFYKTPQGIDIRKALSEKDAFTYTNYCETFINPGKITGILPQRYLKQNWEQWLMNNQKDSVEKSLEALFLILNKYKISYRLSIPELAALPFKDSLHSIHKIISRTIMSDVTPEPKPAGFDPDYLSTYELQRVTDLLDEVYSAGFFSRINTIFYIIEAYFILYFSLLLLCYKLYRRKVFLIAIIGSIILAIMLTLLNITDSELNTPYAYISLCVLFLITAIFFLQVNKTKNLTGAFLNWHILFIPLVVLFVCTILNTRYEDLQYYYDHISRTQTLLPDEAMQQKYPVLHWVRHHTQLISLLNIFLVILYTVLLFLPLSKKWHLMPDE